MTTLQHKKPTKAAALEALEEEARRAQLVMAKNSGLDCFEHFRSQYAATLHQIARLRPLSVYELQNCGLSLMHAKVVAEKTGGARTDQGEPCATIHPSLR